MRVLTGNVMPKGRPGDLNQALMELGACVCVPNGMPHCLECPVQQLCTAHQNSQETQYPHKDVKKPRKTEEKTILVIRDEDKVALRKRPSKGLLAGMYEFPSIAGHQNTEDVLQYLAGMGLGVIRITPMPDAKHIFTHKEWHMKGYMIRVDELQKGRGDADWIYIEPEETRERYPIPSAFETYTDILRMVRGKDSIPKKNTN